jgi:ubiquitin-like protein Pup
MEGWGDARRPPQRGTSTHRTARRVRVEVHVIHVLEVVMAGQEYARPQRRDEEPPEAPDTPPPTPSGAAVKESLDDDIDSVLDEIDGVLESNAEEFVRGFVQKGGQ